MENNLLFDSLRSSQKERKIISVFSDEAEPENCSCGYIVKLSNSQFLMQSISPEGSSDGYIVRKTDDIFRVDFEGVYEKKIGLLYKLRNQTHSNSLDHSNITVNSNLFYEVLMDAKERKLVVSISLDADQDSITGFVKNIDYHSLTASILKLTEQGEKDGTTLFSIEDVEKLDYDTSDEKTLQLLFNFKYKQSKS